MRRRHNRSGGDDQAWPAARELAAVSQRMTPTMMTGSKLVALAIATSITTLSAAGYAGDATWLSCKGYYRTREVTTGSRSLRVL